MLPLILAGAGLAGELGGAGLGALANGQVAAARKAAQDAELQRQQRWDQQIQTLQNQNLQGYNNIQPQMDTRAANVADFYKATGGDLPSSGPTAGTMPPITNAAVANEGKVAQGKVAAYNTQQGQALGNLRSFGDIMGGNARTTAVNNSIINGINSMKTGSASVLKHELEGANSAGGGLRTFADILGGLGKVGVSAGLSGGFGNLFGGATGGVQSMIPGLDGPAGGLT
jgi:hypothetical protein